MILYLRILRYLRPYIWVFLLSAIITLLFAMSNVYAIPLIRDLSNEVANKNLEHFGNQIINAIVLWTVRVITQFGQVYLMTWLSNRIVIDIQMDVFTKLQSCSQHFFNRWKLGELLTRLFNDTQQVKQAIISSFAEAIPQTLTFLGVLGYLFYMNWKLTLFTIITVPVFIFIISYFTEVVKRITKQRQKKISDITHIAQESISNMKLVQAYTMESREKKRYYKENLRNFKVNMKTAKFKGIMNSTVLFWQGMVFILLLFFGGRLVSTGEMKGSELISFFTGIMLLIDPISALSKIYMSIQQALVSARRLFEILDDPVHIQNIKNPKTPTIEGDISFNDISFKYQTNEEYVLTNLSLHAKKGQTVALVGLSGAGKTTIINLIPRFYDVSSGEILVDHIPIKEIDLHTLRSHIGMVLQEDIIFRGTILENIKYGSPGSSEEEIIKAAKQANAWEFIERMPDKLYTKVGDKGQRLSGGQKQRISIARAILRNPKILILDEATSSLDTKSERLVQEALTNLMKGRTTFVIAHRLSTIIHADKIVVLDKGSIVETGTHDELLAKQGHYAQLYNIQFKS